MKGQGSTEYLVILAVVLVVALIVIGLLGGFAGFGTSGAESQSTAYWRGTSPFAIQTVKISGTGDVALEVKSQSSEQIRLTSLTFDGTPIVTSGPIIFAPGAAKWIVNDSFINATVTQFCSGGQYEITTVRFLYTIGSTSIGQIQQGDKALIGKCS